MSHHQYHELLLNLQALNAQAVKCHGKAGALGLKKTTLWLNDVIFENGRKMNLLKTHIESNTVADELDALEISAKISASWDRMTPAQRKELLRMFDWTHGAVAGVKTLGEVSGGKLGRTSDLTKVNIGAMPGLPPATFESIKAARDELAGRISPLPTKTIYETNPAPLSPIGQIFNTFEDSPTGGDEPINLMRKRTDNFKITILPPSSANMLDVNQARNAETPQPPTNEGEQQ